MIALGTRLRRACCTPLLVLSLFAVACEAAEDPTEILVVVDSDLSVPGELASLNIQMFDRAGTQPLHQHDLFLTAQPGKTQFVLPATYLLSRSKGAPDFRLLVTGRDASGTDVIAKQVLSSFQPRERLLMTVYLRRECHAAGRAELLCGNSSAMRGDKTCVLGKCEDPREADLMPAGPGPWGGYDRDGGYHQDEFPVGAGDEPDSGMHTGFDAGSSDAALDAAPDSARDAASDAPDAPAASELAPPPAPECQGDGDCQRRVAGALPAGCAVGRCVDLKCQFKSADIDGDKHGLSTCALAGVTIELGDDCDDANPARYKGAWDGPASDPLPARCDKIDNDCDGTPDNGAQAGKTCVCDPATDVNVDCATRADGTAISWPQGAAVGACVAGKRSCKDGAWTACEGAIEPLSADKCEVAEDDSNCNGVKSEGCECTTDPPRSCGSNVGSCRQGMQACVGGKWATECVGAIDKAAADTCDAGNDANCNGVANEGCACVNGATSTCGQVLPNAGDCVSRTVTCTNGTWPAATCTARCDDCPASACGGNGDCVDLIENYRCNCHAGFTTSADGKMCTPVDPCTGIVCPVNGTCSNGLCRCDQGYLAGPNNSCVADPCFGVNCAPGTCSGGACMCPAGYLASASKSCVTDPCFGVNCAPGTCNGGTCACPANSTVAANGKSCGPVDLCAGVSCGNGGSCSGGQCSCPPGSSSAADGRSCGPIDACWSVSCGNGGSCAGGQCMCPTGSTRAADGRSCGPVNLCANINCGAGTCSPSTGLCVCPAGSPLAADGKSCGPVNLCPGVTCGNGGSCVSSTGLCDCPMGSTRAADGKSCGPVNLCSGVNCGVGVCIQSMGICMCPDGSTPGAGAKSCGPIDRCPGVTCGNGGSCVPATGLCSCVAGSTPAADGKSCGAVAPCFGVSCGNGGSCVAATGRCSCVPGSPLSSDGKSCGPVNLCAPNACAPGGTCAPATGLCTSCAAGYLLSADSRSCMPIPDRCAGVSCGHGGRCVNGPTDYTCECTGGTLTALHLVQSGPKSCGCQARYDDCVPDVATNTSSLGCETPMLNNMACGMCSSCFVGDGEIAGNGWKNYSNPSCVGQNKAGSICTPNAGWTANRCTDTGGVPVCVNECDSVLCPTGEYCYSGRCAYSCPGNSQPCEVSRFKGCLDDGGCKPL